MENGKRFEPLCTSIQKPIANGSESPDLFADTVFIDGNSQELFSSSQRLGGVECREEDPLPPRMAAKNSETDDIVSLRRFNEGDYRYYTLVIGGYRLKPSNISCVYVEHDDHLHVLIKCSGNVGRKIDRILRDCGLPIGEWHQAKLTKILVNNPVKMLRYFKFRGVPVIIGTDLADVWELAQSMTPLETVKIASASRYVPR